MIKYVPLIENKNRKVNTSDQTLLYEFSIINTGKIFHLNWDEMFHFDEEKFITTVKEKYKNNYLFISIDEIRLPRRISWIENAGLLLLLIYIQFRINCFVL